MQIEEISSLLSNRQPTLLDIRNVRHAAVAMILRPIAQGHEVLFIERTRTEGDPWSGQMAFPGGGVEAKDVDARRAAERETLEEVGIDLTATTFVGRLDDMQGRHRAQPNSIVVSGFVYYDEQGQETVPNYEVADIVWEPLASFAEAERFEYVEHPLAPEERFPGVRVGRSDHQVVWGLTRRFLLSFFEITGQPFLSDPAF